VHQRRVRRPAVDALPGDAASCGGTCVDSTSDPQNCGSCGHACTMGLVCASGSCSPRVPSASPSAVRRASPPRATRRTAGAAGRRVRRRRPASPAPARVPTAGRRAAARAASSRAIRRTAGRAARSAPAGRPMPGGRVRRRVHGAVRGLRQCVCRHDGGPAELRSLQQGVHVDQVCEARRAPARRDDRVRLRLRVGRLRSAELRRVRQRLWRGSAVRGRQVRLPGQSGGVRERLHRHGLGSEQLRRMWPPVRAGQVCSSGACACPRGRRSAPTAATSSRWTRTTAARAAMRAARGASANHGFCAGGCGGRETECNGGCSNTFNDPENCGACGAACATGESCRRGACVCAAGFLRATALRQPAQRLGQLRRAAPPARATRRATGGPARASWARRSAAACARHVDRPDNCGACGTKVRGLGDLSVRHLVCGPETNACNGDCVDVLSDPANCGVAARCARASSSVRTGPAARREKKPLIGALVCPANAPHGLQGGSPRRDPAIREA